ncbi:oxidoreductase [Alistipes sp. An116]|uniref:class I SAM-dependent methyltransferase n=1 Tax=Alistipes sp. An116 TaxID=1965546 RepID=UPI000B38F1E6|nr:class I SAM-dependent methyltransferase [Alistipes sp. An116]OUQ53294.1 oxidoreductase [Alistipes sp. An116]
MQQQLTPDFADYELIDTGDFEKLERFGRFVTRRPEPQAIWRRSLPEAEWRRLADASFRRDLRNDERGEWQLDPKMPDRWTIAYAYRGMKLRMRLALTSFKHVGIFPEQAANWIFIYENVLRLCGAEEAAGHAAAGHVAAESAVRNASVAETLPAAAPRVLNLFAYTGGATLAARAAGAEVTHVDSVRSVVTWARENMELSGLDGVRWIVEDALKFVRREVRRGNRYAGIILDPPAYGRGANGEKWVLEENIGEMLDCCAQLLEPRGAFLVLNLYSMGLSSTLARTAVRQAFGAPEEEQWGELCFTDRAGKELPLGTYYRFRR